ncbi:S8 family peptidase [Streptomyces pathocidini]|uniref:S8 family peptidase n=1 Tax=Streptomyces pathocidini TaxID=1650571 RepID=UPI0033FC4458
MALTRHHRLRLAGAVTATAAAAVLAAAALPAHAAPAEGRILGAGEPGAIGGSYIVTLKQGIAAPSSAGKDLARKYGAEIRRTFGAALNGYSVRLSESQAKRLAADPKVASVVQNKTLHITDTQANPPSWGLDRIDQPDLPLNKAYTYPSGGGAGVTAYVIDTGIRTSHQDFGGRAVSGFDAVDGGAATDGNGHGTHVAGTIGGSSYGVAKKVNLVAVRVLDNTGSGTTDQVVKGIDWVMRNAKKPAVANMSLGGPLDPALDTAVSNAIASGVTFAVAAGNSTAAVSTSSPARVPEAITVGATDEEDDFADFSNWGPGVDVLAPGVNIKSAWNTSDTATNTISGTSMATPHVAGASALYLAAHPAATPAQVSAGLTDSAAENKVTDPLFFRLVFTPNILLQVPN